MGKSVCLLGLGTLLIQFDLANDIKHSFYPNDTKHIIHPTENEIESGTRERGDYVTMTGKRIEMVKHCQISQRPSFSLDDTQP